MPPGVNRLRTTQMNDTEKIFVALSHVLSPNTQQFDVHPQDACKIWVSMKPEEMKTEENETWRKWNLKKMKTWKMKPEENGNQENENLKKMKPEENETRRKWKPENENLKKMKPEENETWRKWKPEENETRKIPESPEELTSVPPGSTVRV